MSTNLHEYHPDERGHHSLCRVCGFGRNHPWHEEDEPEVEYPPILDDEPRGAVR